MNNEGLFDYNFYYYIINDSETYTVRNKTELIISTEFM